MNYNDMSMAELREMCAKHGIVAGRSKAETITRIEARDAELQDFANRHGDALAKDGMAIRSGGKDYKPETKLCDCDPVGDAAREHYQGLGKQPCDCQPEADYSGIEARALAHMAEAVGSDGARRVTGFFGEAIMGDVPGNGDAIRWKRSRPRQDVGTVRAFMVPVSGGARHKGGGARPAISYRAGRRNLAKQMRKSARKAAAHLVPA